jgi:hypothetical protein
MEASDAEMYTDLAEKESELDPSSSLILIQSLDQSCFECKLPNRDRVLPCRDNDGKFHATGQLRMIGKDTLREHFLAL